MNKLTKQENFAKEQYQQLGWEVIKPSWPDFIMKNPLTKKIQLVEVKGRGDRLSEKQRRSFGWLQKAGLTVKVAFIPTLYGKEVRERTFKEELDLNEIIGKRKPIGTKKEYADMRNFLKELGKKIRSEEEIKTDILDDLLQASSTPEREVAEAKEREQEINEILNTLPKREGR